jgi:DNA-directed RNA polymerase subunit RPC12/RpoP
MDYTATYKCIDCSTTEYLTFPNKDETYIICGSCYMIRINEEIEIKNSLEKLKKPYREYVIVFD